MKRLKQFEKFRPILENYEPDEAMQRVYKHFEKSVAKMMLREAIKASSFRAYILPKRKSQPGKRAVKYTKLTSNDTLKAKNTTWSVLNITQTNIDWRDVLAITTNQLKQAHIMKNMVFIPIAENIQIRPFRQSL